jgi:hypothetical protein
LIRRIDVLGVKYDKLREKADRLVKQRQFVVTQTAIILLETQRALRVQMHEAGMPSESGAEVLDATAALVAALNNCPFVDVPMDARLAEPIASDSVDSASRGGAEKESSGRENMPIQQLNREHTDITMPPSESEPVKPKGVLKKKAAPAVVSGHTTASANTAAVPLAARMEHSFEALPKHVKGHCKLSEVLELYNRMCEVELGKMCAPRNTGPFAAPGEAMGIDVRDFGKLFGKRASGKTGQNMLLALRSMGYVRLDREVVHIVDLPMPPPRQHASSAKQKPGGHTLGSKTGAAVVAAMR